MSVWSTSKVAGFALAALLANDRELERVEHALPAELLPSARRLLASSGPEREDKAALVAQLLTAVRPKLSRLASDLPPRFRALLAPRLPREFARELLDPSSRSRAGFSPPAELVPRLLRIARNLDPEAAP